MPDPGEDIGEPPGCVLGDEVPSLLVAMDIRVRHPCAQVAEVTVGEDWIVRAPCQQDGHIERADSLGDGVKGRGARMFGRERDVGDEIADGRATRCIRVRRSERASDICGHMARHQGRATQEGGRATRHRVEQGPRPRQSDERGSRGALGLVHRGVGEHDAREHVAVRQCPAQGDGTAPVMRDRDDGPADPQGIGQSAEVRHAVHQTTHPSGTVGVAHADLVDGDHAPVLGRLRKESPPEVGPRGVAVHGEEGDARNTACRALEHVHGDAVDVDGAGPRRIEAREVGCAGAHRVVRATRRFR